MGYYAYWYRKSNFEHRNQNNINLLSSYFFLFGIFVAKARRISMTTLARTKSFLSPEIFLKVSFPAFFKLTNRKILIKSSFFLPIWNIKLFKRYKVNKYLMFLQTIKKIIVTSWRNLKKVKKINTPTKKTTKIFFFYTIF